MTMGDVLAVLVPALLIVIMVGAWRFYNTTDSESKRAWLPFLMVWAGIGLLISAEHIVDRHWGKADQMWTVERICQEFRLDCSDPRLADRNWVERFFWENKLGAPLWPSGTNTTK